MNNHKILCKHPCRDSGLYSVCYSDQTSHCNILNMRAVLYSNGKSVQEDPRIWGDEDMGLAEMVSQKSHNA